jgi:hypothetical protein
MDSRNAKFLNDFEALEENIYFRSAWHENCLKEKIAAKLHHWRINFANRSKAMNLKGNLKILAQSQKNAMVFLPCSAKGSKKEYQKSLIPCGSSRNSKFLPGGMGIAYI